MLTNTKILLLFLCCAFSSFSQPHTKKYASTVQDSPFFTSVDFELTDNLIIVPVTIDNTQYRFLLDTGAINLFSEKLAYPYQVQSLEEEKDLKFNIDNNSNTLIKMSRISFGEVVFQNNIGVVREMQNNLFECYQLDGILGSNFFGNVILQIDYPQRKIYITNVFRKLRIKNKPHRVKYIDNQRSPMIDLTIQNDKRISKDQAIIDTGFNGTYEINIENFSFFSRTNLLTQFISTDGISSTELINNKDKKTYHLVEVPTLKMDQFILTNFYAKSTYDYSKIGNDLLKRGKLTIDFLAGQYFFETLEEEDVQNKVPLLSPTFYQNKLIAGIIWDEELRTKIDFDDQIIEINHHPVNKEAPCELFSLKNENNIFTVLKKDQTTIDVSSTRQTYF